MKSKFVPNIDCLAMGIVGTKFLDFFISKRDLRQDTLDKC